MFLLPSQWSSRYLWVSKQLCAKKISLKGKIKLMRNFSCRHQMREKKEGKEKCCICCQNDSWSRTTYIIAIKELMACYFIQFTKSLVNASIFFFLHPRTAKTSHRLYFWVHKRVHKRFKWLWRTFASSLQWNKLPKRRWSFRQ